MVRKIRDPQSRTRIIDAAQRTIADLGVKGATVRAIAAEAGVSTGYVMHYFEDKDVLARAVLDHTNAQAAARVLAAGRGKRGLEALVAAIEALLPLTTERRTVWQVWVAFWNQARSEDWPAAALTLARGGLAAILAQSFKEAVEDGELPEGLDLQYEGERLTTLAAGLGLLAGVESPARVRRLASRMLADHLEGLRPRLAEV
jgi:AcrR family transcriptional regulator